MQFTSPRGATALTAMLAFAAGASATSPATASSLFGFAKMPAPAPPVLHAHHHRGKAAATTYAFQNVVNVPASIEGAQPLAFNNTGQILGTGYTRNNNACIVLNGATFVVARKADVTECEGTSLSDAVSNTYNFVGYASITKTDNRVAFTASGTGTSIALRTLSGRQPSQLNGVNAGGTAIGTAFYEPRKGFFENQPPFALSGRTFALLQPQCTTNVTGCMEVSVGDFNATNCPFGGCSINNQNIVLGIDDSTENLMVYTVGNESSAIDLPIAWGPAYPAGINNNDQVAYAYYDASDDTYPAYQYTYPSSQAEALGPVPGYACQGYFPISQSNTGEILGFTYNCIGSPGTYWTWDPVNGMQDLGAAIPPNSYSRVTPLGINDNGAILVELYTASGGQDAWGLLVPQGSGSLNARHTDPSHAHLIR